MIPIENFIEDTLRKAKKLPINNCLDLRPFKKDRSILIEKCEDGYNIYEDGFQQNTYKNISLDELKKLLKTLQKIEFPRSNIVRISLLKTKDSNHENKYRR